MKRMAGLTILLAVYGLSAFTMAADLHFITLADTLDTSIGTQEDLDHAWSWAQDIADNTGLRLVFYELSGHNLTADRTRSLLSNLQVASDDVVYFYYSGHGGNPGYSIWPTLYYTNATGLGDEVSFDEVVYTLRPKNPRLLIVLTDCCNNYLWDSGYPVSRPLPFGSADRQSFRHLFLDFQGTILITGSSPGEYGFGVTGRGGVFSNNFMESFYYLARSGQMITWDALLTRAAEETARETALSGNSQNPQYEIEGGLVAGGTPGDENDDGGGEDDSFIGPAAGGCGAAGVTPLILTLCALCRPMNVHRRRRKQDR